MKLLIWFGIFAFILSSCATPQSSSVNSARERSDAASRSLSAEINRQLEAQKEAIRISDDRRNRAVAEQRERLPNAIKKLGDKGLTEGALFWLKNPRGSIPALQRLVFIRVELSSDSDLRFFVKVPNGSEASFDERGGALGKIDPTLSYYLEDPKSFTSKWPKKYLLAINEQKIMMGMTMDQAAAAWGEPNDINNSTGPWGTHVQWVYGKSHHSYLYFKNGRVSSWQN